MHLTNYAINKDNPNFIFNEDEKKMDVGHKRSMTSVFELLRIQVNIITSYIEIKCRLIIVWYQGFNNKNLLCCSTNIIIKLYIDRKLC